MGDDAWRSDFHGASGLKVGELGMAPKCKRMQRDRVAA